VGQLYSGLDTGLQKAAATQFGEVLFGEKTVKKTVDKSLMTRM
jgi:hypothetical protein